jgi:Rieske Fe-S protein
VRWVSDQEKFFCPCHNAIFDKDGTVISGPPPAPLDQFQVKVENDQLYILGG